MKPGLLKALHEAREELVKEIELATGRIKHWQQKVRSRKLTLKRLDTVIELEQDQPGPYLNPAPGAPVLVGPIPGRFQKATNRRTNRTVVLEHLSRAPDVSHTPDQMMKDLGMPVGSVSSTLHVLVREGLVDRTAPGMYRISPNRAERKQ